MQRELTTSLGTVGATQVRFLFGFPFALLSLLGVALITGVALPRPDPSYWPWLLVGALAQIAATALMLAAMGGRSFVVVVAYIKTEPIQVAIFGLIFLSDAVSLPMMIAIVVATAGVLVMSYKPGGMTGGIKPTLVGLASGAMFAVSAIGYRGAILNVSAGHFAMAATFTLACGLVLQAALLTVYLALRDRPVLVAIAAHLQAEDKRARRHRHGVDRDWRDPADLVAPDLRIAQRLTAISTAPAAISAMPSQFCPDGRSPRNTNANTATSMTLSLSIGATCAASPSLSARK
jgi:uncharacterized membrane protein